MSTVDHVTLEVADLAAAERFYSDAFGLGPQVRLRASAAKQFWGGYSGVVQAPDGTSS